MGFKFALNRCSCIDVDGATEGNIKDVSKMLLEGGGRLKYGGLGVSGSGGFNRGIIGQRKPGLRKLERRLRATLAPAANKQSGFTDGLEDLCLHIRSLRGRS